MTPAADYRSRLLAYRTESDRMLSELEPLLRVSDPTRFDKLRHELNEYWRSYAPLFDGTTVVVDRYGFLRRRSFRGAMPS